MGNPKIYLSTYLSLSPPISLCRDDRPCFFLDQNLLHMKISREIRNKTYLKALELSQSQLLLEGQEAQKPGISNHES